MVVHWDSLASLSKHDKKQGTKSKPKDTEKLPSAWEFRFTWPAHLKIKHVDVRDDTKSADWFPKWNVLNPTQEANPYNEVKEVPEIRY